MTEETESRPVEESRQAIREVVALIDELNEHTKRLRELLAKLEGTVT